MNSSIRIGTVRETIFHVESRHAISFPGLPPVLATPWLVWYLEHAALEMLEESLSEGEISVGTQIDLEHLAPTVVGKVVRCRSRIIHIDGPDVTFQVDAADDTEPIIRGVHRRRIVKTDRLARRLARKSSS